MRLHQILDDWDRLILPTRPSVAGEEPQSDQPIFALSALAAVLSRHGIHFDDPTLVRVGWALLGVPATGRVHLGDSRWSRLTHLTELHDMTLPSGARALARQLGSESHLIPDLLQARPWHRESGLSRAEDVLTAIFQDEWSGFLSLLGEFGPWVYVPSVADLQALSRLYAGLVHRAAESQEVEVLTAVVRGHFHAESLLLRLEVTDYRSSGGRKADLSPVEHNVEALLKSEQAFWKAAEDQAQGQRAERVARRRRQS